MNRKETAIKAFTTLAVADDTPNDKKYDFVDSVSVTAIECIAINLAELTDKISDLTAYMQGFAEWIREQQKTK